MPESPTLEFRWLFEQGPGAMLALLPDAAFTIAAATDSLLRATMTTREGTYGRPLFEAFPDGPTDTDATGVRSLRASLERALATRAPDTMPAQRCDLRRPESPGGGIEERQWRLTNTPVFGPDGQVRYLLHQAEDVTDAVGLAAARADAEAQRQRLHAVFMQAPTAIAIFMGPRYVIEQANPLVCRIWGRTREQVLGRPLFEALPEAAGQGFEALLDGVLRTGAPFVGTELPARIARLEGGAIEDVYFNFVYEPLRDALGRVEGVTVFASDGTETVRARRAAEAETVARERLSDGRLRQVVEASGIGMWALDVDADRVTADARFYALTGLATGAPMTRERFLGAAPLVDREVLTRAFDAALAGEHGGRYTVEHRTLGPGSAPERWVEARGRAIFDEAGRAVRLEGTLADIGERKQAERERETLLAREAAARAEAEAQRRQQHDVFMQAPVAIAILEGPEHVFSFANPAYRNLVGGRDVLGLPLREALPDVDGMGFDVLLDHVMRTGEPYAAHEVTLRLAHHADGESVILDFTYSPKRSTGGAVDGVMALVVDVTTTVRARHRVEALAEEVRASEAQLRLVMDALPLLVSFVTSGERYALVNKAYEGWFGEPHAAIAGRTVREFVGEAAYESLGPLVQRALAGEGFAIERYQVPYRSGGTRDVKITFIPHRGTPGRVDGYVSLIEDITVRRRFEEERRRQAEFEQQLIGIVSHDLRNPLNAILLSSRLLTRRESLSAHSIKGMVRIQNAAERATRMVNDLLDFTQSRLGGGIRIQPCAADLHAVTRAVLEEIEAAYPDRAVLATSDGDGAGEWDADRLAQVVQNLVTNALGYSPAGSAVRVTTRGEGDRVSLSVRNAGEPIPAPMLQRIFEPLQRGASEIDRTGRSIGLGLYIVKELVDAHAGTLGVESTEAAGTTFTVTLPRVAPTASAG
jgi:PAS domain S-box-containing protein